MTTIYCWGNTAHGELGLGGVEDEQILSPRMLPWSTDAPTEVVQISCGRRHSLCLSSTGKVYSCGDNDDGQLGHEQQTKRPQLIVALYNYNITRICSGAQFSVALTDIGQLFTWGFNHYGQLGTLTSQERNSKPKLLQKLQSKTVIQVACGNNHCMALINSGELYTWGSNMYGQLGVAGIATSSDSPQLVSALYGIPIAFIACGGNHSFVISKSGAVFGWGRNECGQLGLNDTMERRFPTQLKTMRTLGVRYIACGGEFSVFLTKEGRVFTCGSGSYGQLGHGRFRNEVVPRMIVELMGSVVTQVACGSRHMLAFVPNGSKIFSCGLGSLGQLGTKATTNSSVPQLVMGSWMPPADQSSTHQSNSVSYKLKQIYCGGDQSMIICTYPARNIPPNDCREYDEDTQLLVMTESLAKECAEQDEINDVDLLSKIAVIFQNQACINGSFLLDDDQHFCCKSNNHGIDFNVATRIFNILCGVENESLKCLIWDKITNVLLQSFVRSPADVETLRIFLTLPLYHEFVNSKHFKELHSPLSYAVGGLESIPRQILSKWWAVTPSAWFERMVTNFRNVVAHIIIHDMPTTGNRVEKKVVKPHPHLLAALKMIEFLHVLNQEERVERVHYAVFQWPELVDHVDIPKNYLFWVLETHSESFNICNYPMLFDASAKTNLLQSDQAMQMHQAMYSAARGSTNMLNLQAAIQFLLINVSRENIVNDTLHKIRIVRQSDLKKPLMVKFYGEEAEDAGGVRKEFFMLVTKKILDPKYGMFQEYEDSRTLWFSAATFEQEEMYFLIGIICGLAIYNFTIINLPFPLALYKKLLNAKIDLSDLRDLTPQVANSLQNILDYEGEDLEEVFGICFEITIDNFGEKVTKPLKPNGNNIPVTKENRQEFVDLYVDYIFNKSVEGNFKAFHRGFMKVCCGRVLGIFRPEELMAMVVGNEEYDWQVLQEICEYKNGYSAENIQIKWFWEIFQALPEEDKRKFLLFLTGSDRIPIQGMKSIKIYIQPTGDDRYLPVAHTCFNLLDLPRYTTKEQLKHKLLQAIEQTHGFSLV